MREFLLKLLGILPLIIGIAILNYTLDSRFIFKTDPRIKNISKQIDQGKFVYSKSEFNQHELVWHLLNEIERHRNIAVFGSSKSMNIRSEHLNSGSFINMHTSGANIIDFLALSNQMLEQEKLPDTLIIEFSPVLFHKGHRKLPRKYVSECKKFCRNNNINPPSTAQTNYREYTSTLFSLSYLFNNVDRIYSGELDVWHENMVEYDPGYYIIRPDGSLWPGPYDNWSQIRRIKAIMNENIDFLTKIKRPNHETKLCFRTLLDVLAKNEVNVILYLPPYHPETYVNYVKGHPLIHQIIEFRDSLILHHDVSYFGSYDPSFFGLSDKDFYDGIHLTDAGMEKVWDHFQRPAKHTTAQ